MRLPFIKMHGLGNDFVVIDAAEDARVPDSEIWRRLGDRRTGIGFDQALVLLPPRTAGTDVFYRIFNSDGSEVEQCGNGARCIARVVSERVGRSNVVLDSPGGRLEARVREDGLVAVNMGVPNFSPSSLPFKAEREAARYALDTPSGHVEFGAVSMGNPHAVIRVDDVMKAPVDTLGPAVQNQPQFPAKVNVGFMQVIDRGHIRLRVYERGAGETQACGTGACAAVAVGQRWELLDRTVQVQALGGRLTIEWHGVGSALWMTGPAEKSFEGQVSI